MEVFLITHGVAFVAGCVAMLVFAKWQPTWFLKAETAVSQVTGVKTANT